MHRPLYPQGKSPWYQLDRRLGGPQSRSGRGGEEKNSQPLPGLEPTINHYVLSQSVNVRSAPCLEDGEPDKNRSGMVGGQLWLGRELLFLVIKNKFR
jgi:hypothetical protein